MMTRIEKALCFGTLGLVAFASIALAQASAAQVRGQSQSGNMTWVADELGTAVTQTAGIRRVVMEGSPFIVKWHSEGLTVTGRKFDGLLREVGKNEYMLQQATIEGDATVELIQKDPSAGTRNTRLKSQKITLTSGANETSATLTGNVDVTSKATTNNQLLSLSGPSGRLTMPPLTATGQFPIRTALISGPVKLRMESDERRSGQLETIVVNATGSVLTYDDKSRILNLENADFTGENSLLFGSMQAELATVQLTETRTARSINFKRSKGTLQEKKG